MKKLLSIILSVVLLVASLGAITTSAANVTITVNIGDVNGSGEINNRDYALLMQYLNKWDVDIIESAADVNGDGDINNRDYALLMQYLNKWDVTLGAQSGNIANSIKGKTIKFASTIDPALDESGPVVEKFEEEYGVTVEIVACSLDNYIAEMQGLIAAGDSPDVVRSNGDFPAFLAYTQSLDAAKLDYTDPIWDQNMFEMTTFGGSPYLCNTVGNIWAEQDIVVYSKSWLKRAGAYTPEEYDREGKWTWDAFFKIARAVSKLGIPGGIMTQETALHAMGGNVFRLEDGKIVNGIDSNAQAAMTRYATVWKEGILEWSDETKFSYSAFGISTAPLWVLKKAGPLADTGVNYNDIGFYYLPRNSEDSDYACTGIFRGWGIAKGANEPVAAGVFLREYLDINNYDVSSAFINDEAMTFFFTVTDINNYDNYNPYFTYIELNKAISGIDYSADIYSAMVVDPAQVAVHMRAVQAYAGKGATNLNNFIERNTGIN